MGPCPSPFLIGPFLFYYCVCPQHHDGQLFLSRSVYFIVKIFSGFFHFVSSFQKLFLYSLYQIMLLYWQFTLLKYVLVLSAAAHCGPHSGAAAVTGAEYAAVLVCSGALSVSAGAVCAQHFFPSPLWNMSGLSGGTPSSPRGLLSRMFFMWVSRMASCLFMCALLSLCPYGHDALIFI